ncbi:hypothetical protein [Bacillus toyonensis]|uniref:hypothetical protein n=1 Tax=Bacillus toyonensis TaxID=155322 RepID=UPI000BEF337B|nr:hypothetical protein [Bacillus toyonensis]PEK30523.1 hypothetical protein CN897_27285 [Bacillus toyonensis]
MGKRNDLFPHIQPDGDNVRVWDFEGIKQYKGSGLYVFWGRDVAQKEDFKDRHCYDYQHSPLYIGKATDLADRIMKHIKGKTHTKHFCGYFYSVDIFQLSNLDKVNHQAMYKQEFLQYQKEKKKLGKKEKVVASEELEMRKGLARLQKIKNDSHLSIKELKDLYELYFIIHKLPFFNHQSNSLRSGSIEWFFKNVNYIDLHRRTWAPNEVYEKPDYDFTLCKKIYTSLNAGDEFNKNKVGLDRWYSEKEFIGKIISRRGLDKRGVNAKELRKIIKRQIKDRKLDKLTIDYSGRTVKVSYESVVLYERFYS